MTRGNPSRLTDRWTRRRFAAAAASLAAVPAVGAASALPASQVKTLRFALTSSDRVRVLPLLADYERETGVKVVPVTFGNLYRALSVELTRGICSFDIVSIDDPWAPLFAGGRFLMSLDALGDSTGRPLDVSDLLPAFLSLGLAPGSTELFAVPWIGNVQVYGYDVATFADQGIEPPRTWRATIDAASRITRAFAPERYGFGLRGQPGNSATATFLPFLRGHGVELFDAEWRPQLETDAASEAMSTLLELVELSPENVVETGHEELAVQLETGTIAQSVDVWPTQLLGWRGEAMGEPVTSVRIAPSPRELGIEAHPVTGTWLLGVPAACVATGPAALEFVRWLIDPVRQLRLLFECGLPPTRAGVFADPDAIERQPLLPTIAELAAGARPRPRTHYFPAIEDVVGYWVSAALAGVVSGEQALTNANTELQAVVRPEAADPT